MLTNLIKDSNARYISTSRRWFSSPKKKKKVGLYTKPIIVEVKPDADERTHNRWKRMSKSYEKVETEAYNRGSRSILAMSLSFGVWLSVYIIGRMIVYFTRIDEYIRVNIRSQQNCDLPISIRRVERERLSMEDFFNRGCVSAEKAQYPETYILKQKMSEDIDTAEFIDNLKTSAV